MKDYLTQRLQTFKTKVQKNEIDTWQHQGAIMLAEELLGLLNAPKDSQTGSAEEAKAEGSTGGSDAGAAATGGEVAGSGG